MVNTIKQIKKIILLVVVAILLIFPIHTNARSSENYKINADVIGLGGNLSDSENYKLTDTLGEPVVGVGSSESYKFKAGFWHEVENSISMIIDADLVEFGNLDPGTPLVQESTMDITTDTWAGYQLMIREVVPMTNVDGITTVPDYTCLLAAPCVWSGIGMGFTVKSGTGVDAKWGTDPNYKYAAFPDSNEVFHTKPDYKSGPDETVVQYKVDISSSQRSGTYNGHIVYTALAIL